MKSRVTLVLLCLTVLGVADITYLDSEGRFRFSRQDTIKVTTVGASSVVIGDSIYCLPGDTFPVLLGNDTLCVRVLGTVPVSLGNDTVYVTQTDTVTVLVSDTANVRLDSLPCKYADGKPRVSAVDYLHDIAEGNVAGHTPWSKIGYNGDVDVESEDMWAVGGRYIFPATQRPMEVVSSNAADAGDGVGVRSVLIYYLDSTYAEKVDTVTLTGVTPALTNTDIFRINAIRSLTCGDSGFAIGNIDVRDTTDTPIYTRISAEHNRGRTCVYTVPVGKTLYITSISFAIGGTSNAKSAVFTTMANYDNVTGERRSFFQSYTEVILIDDIYYRELEMPTKLPEKVDLRVRCTGATANCATTCALRGWLE